jgi:P protein
MAIPVILVMVQGYFQLRFMYRDMKKLRSDEPKAVRELKHELTVWERAAATLSSCSKDEDILRKTLEKKVKKLNRKLEKQIDSPVEGPSESFEVTLADLESKYAIKDKALLWKSCVTLTIVIVFFFLHSFPEIQKLSLGWTALLGAILLLVLYDREDLDAILSHVEWSTLLFFAALFILMEALSELGLINFIGQQTERVILSVGEDARLAVAILIILWVSALASAFVDNIPLTTMMIKIVIDLSENEALELPLQPLVWSLALGACLGGKKLLIIIVARSYNLCYCRKWNVDWRFS